MQNNELTELTSKNFSEVLSAESKSVVIFTASWCGPCRAVKPKIPEIAEENGAKAYWIDAEKNMDLALEYKVQAVPFIATFKNGTLVESFATNNIQKISEMVSNL